MAGNSLGLALLAGVLLAAGVAGLAAAWTAWPRTSATSPLMAIVALSWGGTCLAAAILTWRRSQLAAPVVVLAIAFLLFPARFLIPGGQLFLPSLLVIGLLAVAGYRLSRRMT